jgi:hypothetical protein
VSDGGKNHSFDLGWLYTCFLNRLVACFNGHVHQGSILAGSHSGYDAGSLLYPLIG